ncbi:glycosyltransferase [Shewanella vesiculosa]|uniref:Glycosyltransferase n=1 Tax=Shewanella vesiculosa TaxID=518738 RepID=A0ABV0FMX4_9GAMM
MELVTVYIPTYNRSDLLARAILSVLNQSYTEVEIIVIDDNSTDDTYAVVQDFIKNDLRVKYFKNNENMGACFNRNLAIRLSTGYFLTGLDDDDYFTADRIEMFVNKWWGRDKNVIALYSNITVKEFDNFYCKRTYPEKVNVKSLYIKNDVGNQIFTTKEYLNSSCCYDVNLKSCQDLELWIKLLTKHSFSSFINVDEYTYVLDKSHPHERISSSSIEKHTKSINYIVDKYNIKGLDKNRLISQVFTYDVRSIKLSYLVKHVLLSFNLYIYLRIIKYYIFNKKSR